MNACNEVFWNIVVRIWGYAFGVMVPLMVFVLFIIGLGAFLKRTKSYKEYESRKGADSKLH
jgi:hypothetical protein